nr:hypothetical protein [Coleofasciculus sp. FACHB-1120]
MTVSEKHDTDRELRGQGLANIILLWGNSGYRRDRPHCHPCLFWWENPSLRGTEAFSK